MSCFVSNTLRKNDLPKIDFCKIKEKILGKKYELSVLICGDKLSQKLNKSFRNKNYIPNTLSFPYDENSGEIILNPRKAKKEAGAFGHDFKTHLIFLFIHSLLHLKGMTHSYKMEKEEEKWLKYFLDKTKD